MSWKGDRPRRSRFVGLLDAGSPQFEEPILIQLGIMCLGPESYPPIGIHNTTHVAHFL